MMQLGKLISDRVTKIKIEYFGIALFLWAHGAHGARHLWKVSETDHSHGLTKPCEVIGTRITG